MLMSILVWAQEVVLTHINVILDCLGHVCIWVELPVQRRLCLIFVREVGSPDIHECFRGLTDSQRTPWFWGITFTIHSAIHLCIYYSFTYLLFIYVFTIHSTIHVKIQTLAKSRDFSTHMYLSLRRATLTLGPTNSDRQNPVDLRKTET